MAFTASYSADPRLKRPASNPPDVPRNQKRPATLDIRESSPALASNTSATRSDGVGPPPALAADMARKSRIATIVDLKMQINLQTVATTNLQLKHDHAESQVKNAETDFERAKTHFASFPAMRETKTAAIDRAKKVFKAAREPLQSARQELRRLIGSLVELEQSSKVISQDVITRAEFHDLKKDLVDVKNVISSFKQDLSDARETIEGVQANRKADQDTTTKALEDVRRTIAGLATRIDSHSTRVDVAPSNIPAPSDTGLSERLSVVESDLRDLELEISNVTQTIGQHVQGELQVSKDALVEVKIGLQNTENVVAVLQNDVKRADEDTRNIREALAEGVDVQHTNAQTLQGCLDRLAKIEPLLEQAADKDALAAVKSSLQTLSDVVNSINAAKQKTTNGNQPKATNGITSGLAPFKPVFGGDDEDDVSPFHSRPIVPNMPRVFNNDDFAQMKAEIEALKFKVQDQTNRYNNLLTDQLAQNILDNLGAVYPNLKEAERVIKSMTELQGRLSTAEANMNEFYGRTGVVADRVDALDKATATQVLHRQDVQTLRDDLRLLSNKVNQHSIDIESGRKQLQEHTAAIELNANNVRGIEAWIANQE